MLKFLLVVFLCISFACTRTDIIGGKEWSYWKAHSEWTNISATGYYPDKTDIGKLEEQLRHRDVEIVLFAGTWCHDSEREVPRLMKALRAAGIDTDKMQVIGTDPSNTKPEKLIRLYKPDYSPTLIILSEGKEIGRIEEEPDNSWERDIWQIIRLHHQ